MVIRTVKIGPERHPPGLIDDVIDGLIQIRPDIRGHGLIGTGSTRLKEFAASYSFGRGSIPYHSTGEKQPLEDARIGGFPWSLSVCPTPDRTSKSLVITSNSIVGGRAFTQVRSYPRTLLADNYPSYGNRVLDGGSFR